MLVLSGRLFMEQVRAKSKPAEPVFKRRANLKAAARQRCQRVVWMHGRNC